MITQLRIIIDNSVPQNITFKEIKKDNLIKDLEDNGIKYMEGRHVMTIKIKYIQ